MNSGDFKICKSGESSTLKSVIEYNTFTTYVSQVLEVIHEHKINARIFILIEEIIETQWHNL